MSYADFLASKARIVGAVGPAVEADALHPSLFDFQRAIAAWAVRKGRAAVFADTGLGKTRVQLEWARHVAPRVLILAPLTVARQTAREAEAVDMDVPYVRSPDDAKGPGVWITNYEMAHHFDPDDWDGVVLDESSILKNVDGKTRRFLTERFGRVKYRLACTATPAPNDVGELTNHAEFLGAMSRRDMLANFFIHDDAGWRLKGHARGPLFEWMASWAVALRHPSDLGYSDDGYILPPLRIHAESVEVNVEVPGRLFATELGGVGGRAAVRRATADSRVERAVGLILASWQAPNTSASGTNATRNESGPSSETTERRMPSESEHSDGSTTERTPTGSKATSEPIESATPNADVTVTSDSNTGSLSSNSEPSSRSKTDDVASAESRSHLKGSTAPTSTTTMPPARSGASFAPDATLASVTSTTTPTDSGQRPTTSKRQQWIVWCGLNDEQDAVARALGDRCVSVYGTLSPDEKEARIERWLNGDVEVLVSKPSVCGFGLNFQQCASMVFLGLSDSFEAYYQCIRRCWRFGQRRPVDVHIVVSELEQQIVDNVRRKEQEASRMTADLVAAIAREFRP